MRAFHLEESEEGCHIHPDERRVGRRNDGLRWPIGEDCLCLLALKKCAPKLGEVCSEGRRGGERRGSKGVRRVRSWRGVPEA